MKTLLVTGYRAHELGIFDDRHQAVPYIKKALARRIAALAEEGLEWVITAGQYGVDLWACEAVLEMKEQYPGLKLGIVTAHEGVEEKWKEEKQETFRRITLAADYFGSVSKGPYEGGWQMRARDELLLRKSDAMLLFYDEEAAEGSPRFIKEKALKLQEKGEYELLTLYAEEVQNAAEEERTADWD